jgi:HPt (histidine-containing phosphotransfer) domain-containing protein
LVQIREAIARRDAPSVGRLAHTLKGEVGNFGARAAFQAALKVEMLGRSGNLEGIEPAWAALEAEVQRLLPALTALTAS